MTRIVNVLLGIGMKDNKMTNGYRLLLTTLLFSISIGVSSCKPSGVELECKSLQTTASVLDCTRAADADIKSRLGINLIGVTVLLDSGHGIYRSGDSISPEQQQAIAELERRGFILVHRMTTPDGVVVQLDPTTKGEAVFIAAGLPMADKRLPD